MFKRWNVDLYQNKQNICIRRYRIGTKFESKGILCENQVNTVPIKAKRSSSGILLTTKLDRDAYIQQKGVYDTMRTKPKYVRDAIGRIQFNKKCMVQLNTECHTRVKLIAAIVGWGMCPMVMYWCLGDMKFQF